MLEGENGHGHAKNDTKGGIFLIPGHVVDLQRIENRNEGFPFLPSCLFKYPHQSEEFHQIQDGADQKNDPGIIAREYQNLECCPWKEYQIHNLTVFILSQLDWK